MVPTNTPHPSYNHPTTYYSTSTSLYGAHSNFASLTTPYGAIITQSPLLHSNTTKLDKKDTNKLWYEPYSTCLPTTIATRDQATLDKLTALHDIYNVQTLLLQTTKYSTLFRFHMKTLYNVQHHAHHHLNQVYKAWRNDIHTIFMEAGLTTNTTPRRLSTKKITTKRIVNPKIPRKIQHFSHPTTLALINSICGRLGLLIIHLFPHHTKAILAYHAQGIFNNVKIKVIQRL